MTYIFYYKIPLKATKTNLMSGFWYGKKEKKKKN